MPQACGFTLDSPACVRFCAVRCGSLLRLLGLLGAALAQAGVCPATSVVHEALDVRLDKLWRHQPDGMAHRPELARPVVRATASLHSDKTRWNVQEERRHLVPAQLLLRERLAVLVDSVDLEQVLRQVDAGTKATPMTA